MSVKSSFVHFWNLILGAINLFLCFKVKFYNQLGNNLNQKGVFKPKLHESF